MEMCFQERRTPHCGKLSMLCARARPAKAAAAARDFIVGRSEVMKESLVDVE